MALPSDPDAQATVTDFLDFTEYLPADIARSSSVIALCEENYLDASKRAYDFTKQLQELPLLANGSRPDTTSLRTKIAEAAHDIINSRTLALSEARRQLENLDRHLNRARTIEAKLLKRRENYPESRESSPVPRQSASPQATRPKITLRLDGARSGTDHEGLRLHRRPIRRIVVPGEVLAPNEVDFEEYWGSSSDDSDSDDDELSTSRQTPRLGTGRINLKIPKLPKIKGPKPPRAPRPAGMMGTNVHSAVAGISTSNALAKLKPPPEDAVIGSEHRPWLRLTQYELAKLRKRMKKNAVWTPSATMVNRELKDLGRGKEEFDIATRRAIEQGLPPPVALPPSEAELAEMANMPGAMVEGTVGTATAESSSAQDVQLTNRGMILNIQKKQKREAQAKQAWKDAAQEAEQSARKVKNVADVMRDLFARDTGNNLLGSTPSKPLLKPVSPAKRKRTSTPPEGDTISAGATKADGTKTEGGKVNGEVSTPAIKPNKRPKTETPIPPPKSSVSINAAALLARSRAQAEQSPAADSTVDSTTPSITSQTTTTIIPLKGASPPKKSSTPILPPTKDKKSTPAPIRNTSVNTRSVTPGQVVTRRQTPAATTPAPDSLPARRSSSRGKAPSVEPQSGAGRDRPRRSSTAHNTPAPEGPARPPSRQHRRKRPAPGPVTSAAEGSTVSVGRRSAATRKKAGPKKQRDEEKDVAEIWDEIDDEGNVIDPDEPRYCICNRVSFGVMICCENNDCEKEWFHLECVGLTDIPPRTTKWYCPDCRVTLGIGEKGEVTARGKKK